MLILFLLLPPLIATLIAMTSKKNFKLIEVATITGALIQFISSLCIVYLVIHVGPYSFTPFFKLDPLGALLILITSVVTLASVSYNIKYIRQEISKKIIGLGRARESYIFINLFSLAMFLATTATNPIITWISIEATTLSTVFLISFYNRPTTIEAAWKYLVINSVGLMLGFLGTVIFMAIATPSLMGNALTWESILPIATRLNPDVVKMAFIFILIGYGTKLGIAPMHTWRPDAYSKAPIPVVALLSGALLNIAFLPILRFKMITDLTVGVWFTQYLFIFLGVLSVIIAGLAMFKQENYKRLLAYSSVEHAGIILLGFGFGGFGIYAGLLHMIYHSLAKTAMFLLSGNIFLKYSSPKIGKVSGVLHSLPYTGILFIVGFLGLTAIPPFGLFMSEFYILLVGSKNYLWIIPIIMLALALVFFGFFREVSYMIFGRITKDIKVGEFGKWTIIPPAALLGLLIALSFFIPNDLQILLNNTVSLFK